MKVLVTGASGFLGGRLCHALLRQGYSVRAFVRSTSDLSCLPPPTYGGGGGGALELAYGDVTDYQSLLAACSGCHIIFHAAALVEPWLPDPSRFVTVNVGGLKNVLQAYKETKTIEKIIYTSSFFALGSTDGYVADESQIHHGKFFCTEYEKSKAVADKIALEAASEGVPIVAVYPGVVYGPGKVTSGNTVARLIIERFNGRLPGYIGSGNDRFSFSHVDDVVEGHIAALNKGQPGERYLLTGENASFMHVFDIAAAITETNRPRFHIPLSIIEVYGWISILFCRITRMLPLISPPTVCVLRHQWAYSCEKAKTELEYNPRSLKEGLAEVKGATPRIIRKQVVAVRRSNRVANKPAPEYREVVTYERIELRGRDMHKISKRRDLSNRVYASDEARALAIAKAEELESGLEADYPTFVKPMTQSHVTGGFWLGLPSHFCRRNLPRRDETVTLVDEEGLEYPTVYLPRKAGLSGGWKGFSVDHGLVDGDALVFQLIRPTVFKVYIIRTNSYEEGTKL